MSTTTRAAKFSESDAAKILGCDVRALRIRQVALGLVKPCGRCGGSGSYSYNAFDGTRRQDAGELDAYFATNRARHAAKKRIAPLAEEAKALYEPIAAAYDVEYRAKYRSEESREMDLRIVAAQQMANSIRWGHRATDGGFERTIQCSGVSEIESALRFGNPDVEVVVAELEERVEMMKALRAAFDAVAVAQAA